MPTLLTQDARPSTGISLETILFEENSHPNIHWLMSAYNGESDQSVHQRRHIQLGGGGRAL